MKDLIAVTIAGVLLWWVFLWPDDAWAQPEVKEFSMKSETGEVVLTQEPCTFIKMGLKNYPYAAYATEKGHANHEGCWRLDNINGMRSVLIYFPEIDATGVYNPELFQPRAVPSVQLEPRFEGGDRAMLYEVFTF